MSDEPPIFSRDWYNEYFRRALYSRAHSQFCEKVYGRDLCQHGMQDIQELDFLISLIEPHSKILEIGCSNGYITEYISDHTHSEILGLDFSDVAIAQAQARTQAKRGSLQFTCLDLTRQELPGGDYDRILLIDSIYFMDDLDAALEKISRKLSPTGKLLITFFQFMDDQTEKPLLPGNTRLAEALHTGGFAFESYDFTSNVKSHWLLNYQVGEELREAFEKEGNQFLYQARLAENREFKAYVEKDTIVRFLYVAKQAVAA